MTEPRAPLDAASVVLVRPLPRGGWECFMLRRPAQSDFAADVYVFPGGKVDPEDREPGLWPVLDVPPSVAGCFDDLPFRVAAVRELFEEAGVLLTGQAAAGGCAGVFEVDVLANMRAMLRSRRLTMADVARQQNVTLGVSALHPLSRWITPEDMPHRYDTRFYVAPLPAGQEPLHAPEEATAGRWMVPAEALEAFHSGRFPLVFATEKHLERIGRYATVNDLISAVTARDLDPIMPKRVRRDGSTTFLMPGDEGY